LHAVPKSMSSRPSLSCLGALRQFQLLFPGVVLRLAGGRDLLADGE